MMTAEESREYWFDMYKKTHEELAAAEQEIKELKCEYEKQIKRLKAALRGLYDCQNGAPLIREQKVWEAAMADAEEILRME